MDIKPGGWSREITKRELPVSDTFAIVDMHLSPGAREMHSHQQSEFGFVLVGGARVTAVDEMGRNFIADCKPGEGWIFPKNIPQSIQGLGEGCEFLMLFDKVIILKITRFPSASCFLTCPRMCSPQTSGAPNPPLTKLPPRRSISQTAAIPERWNPSVSSHPTARFPTPTSTNVSM